MINPINPIEKSAFGKMESDKRQAEQTRQEAAAAEAQKEKEKNLRQPDIERLRKMPDEKTLEAKRQEEKMRADLIRRQMGL